jgi:hypothetical protein
MNPYEMVVAIVVIGAIASTLQARFKFAGRRARTAADPEAIRLREEVKALRERIQVLERIATDKEGQLEREIERLRDR